MLEFLLGYCFLFPLYQFHFLKKKTWRSYIVFKTNLKCLSLPQLLKFLDYRYVPPHLETPHFLFSSLGNWGAAPHESNLARAGSRACAMLWLYLLEVTGQLLDGRLELLFLLFQDYNLMFCTCFWSCQVIPSLKESTQWANLVFPLLLSKGRMHMTPYISVCKCYYSHTKFISERLLGLKTTRSKQGIMSLSIQ